MPNEPENQPPGGKRLSEEAIKQANEILYGVGYKHPPKHSQFQKGRSGNPRGRPRGVAPDLSTADQPTLEAVLRASRKPVKMREGDKITEVSSIEAVIQATIAAALKGNARSQGLAIDLARTAEQSHARDIAQMNEFWSDYKDGTSRLIEEARAQGRPEPELTPHPDDIVIDHREGPKFLGPINEDEQRKCEETIAFCNVLLMQDALDQRSTERHNGDPMEEPGGALLLFYQLQSLLPPRLRTSTVEASLQIDRNLIKPKRQLLKDLHQAWNKLGVPASRGVVSPNLGDMRKKFELMMEIVVGSEEGRLDLDAMEKGEFDENAMELLRKYGSGEKTQV